MPISFRCSGCNTSINAPDSAAGKKAKCPKCAQVVVVPAAAGVAAGKAAAAPPKKDAAAPAAKAAVAAPAVKKPAAMPEKAAISSGAPPRTASAPAPRSPSASAAAPSPQAEGVPWLRLVPAGVLALTMVGILVADFIIKGRPRVQITEGKDEDKDSPDQATQGDDVEEILVSEAPIDTKNPRIKLDEAEKDRIEKARKEYPYLPPANFGLVAAAFKGGALKKLTYSSFGGTNDTAVMINGKPRPMARDGWFAVKKPLENADEAHLGSFSQWQCPVGGDSKGSIVFDQILEILPSKQPDETTGKRSLDTLRVRWVIHNKDEKPNKVGLRFVLDTFIGENDGVPFTVPGKGGLIDKDADYKGKEVPDFVQALEGTKKKDGSFQVDLANPGTVAHLSLKLGGGIEAPDRVSLTAFPKEQVLKQYKDGTFYGWDVPVTDMREKKDSAVVLYWSEKEIEPGEKREIGFAYGLGAVTSEEGSKLGLTFGGTIEVGSVFSITTYVKNPQKGQTVTLELPKGLSLDEEEPPQNLTQKVPAPDGGQETVEVTWRARVESAGNFPVIVKSSDGSGVKKTLRIAQAGGKFKMELVGKIAPKKDFTVRAYDIDRVPGQKLTLNLPQGMELVDGSQQQLVPETKVVTWKVRVIAPGTHRVEVSSSTGQNRSRSITLAGSGGIFK